MSIIKIVCLAVAASGLSPVARGERLWPDHLRLSTDAGAMAQASAATWLTARAGDLQALTYLAGMAAGAEAGAGPAVGLPRAGGRWAAAAAPANDGDPEAAAPGELIEALNALGPTTVSMADYLALALPGLFAGPSPGKGVAGDNGQARSSAVTAPALTSFMPNDSVTAAASTPAARRQRWSLPSALSDQLTRYLFLAAMVTLVAGAGLRLARLTRRSGSRSMMRL